MGIGSSVFSGCDCSDRKTEKGGVHFGHGIGVRRGMPLSLGGSKRMEVSRSLSLVFFHEQIRRKSAARKGGGVCGVLQARRSYPESCSIMYARGLCWERIDFEGGATTGGLLFVPSACKC
ncbi:hypothetical protein KP509_30G067100 [Ceratopteris richardii]|uniref:Uncharacterized protein n=1 Tax=Ceratopteris richardii TaxID=49495 RepID=A0A8T2R3D6_CERRI|nr:hypothetical protein KP509_30G067100 [Ceratopteris richardii]